AERWGGAGAAFVVLREGMPATGDELRAHCGERLARFKVPRTVALVDELPRSALGKVLKDELRETAGGVRSGAGGAGGASRGGGAGGGGAGGGAGGPAPAAPRNPHAPTAARGGRDRVRR